MTYIWFMWKHHSEKPENNLRFIESAEKVIFTKDYFARGKTIAKGD